MTDTGSGDGLVVGEDGLARPPWASVDPMLRDPDRVAAYDERDVERLLDDPGIVRNRLKIGAAITC